MIDWCSNASHLHVAGGGDDRRTCCPLKLRGGRLARKGRRVDCSALCGVFKEVRHLPTQGTKIVGQGNSNRITPGRASGREIDLIGSWV